ncbi:MAG: aminoglycoside phosphotransferase family protein [Bacteroidales bacterium]|nr:aminoglycoside phosphotransferase family protein [Bacteroidales bacterium]
MKINDILGQFEIKGVIYKITTLGEGFINDTYTITTCGNSPDYLLQKKNKSVFPDIPGMMSNIEKVTAHIKKKLKARNDDPYKGTLTIIKTKKGSKSYFQDPDGNFWTVCLLIPDAVSYNIVDDAKLAYKGGTGIGDFQQMLSDFDLPLDETIKGFHNIIFKLREWDKCLKDDPAGRISECKKEIDWIEKYRNNMTEFYKDVENGKIPRRITHNDTKISNILFDKNNNILGMVDLDTVMRAPAFNDFGDAIRTYASTAAEDEPDISKIALDMNMYKAFTKGYLKYMNKTLTSSEKQSLPFSVLYITYEQALRFLMDYINGDTYYKTKYEKHNLVRAHSQTALFKSIEEHFHEMENVVFS